VYRIKSTKIRSVVLAMAVTLVASATFQITSYRNARRMEHISARDAHVRDVLAALAALRSAEQEAIIAQRGYLLGPDPQELEAYRSAAGRVPAMLAQVRALTLDDPVQSAYARDLQPLIETKLKDLERAMHQAGKEVPGAVLALRFSQSWTA